MNKKICKSKSLLTATGAVKHTDEETDVKLEEGRINEQSPQQTYADRTSRESQDSDESSNKDPNKTNL